MKNLLVLITALVSINAAADDLLKDFDTLGGNDVLLQRAKALNPDAKIGVVQDRVVKRRLRLEIAPEFSGVVGGDSYTNTKSTGVNMHFHITPNWSIGAKYNYHFNELRAEGENLLKEAVAAKKQKGNAEDSIGFPDIDYAKQSYMALVNWYPLYGKMNLYDLGVTHFDMYALVGGGQIVLRSTTVPTYTAGGGIGLWFSQHLTTRLELRYQTYKATRYDGEVTMNTTVGSVQVGYML